MNKKILTISIAAYNAEKWLTKCLDSFMIPEILDDLEVIIVNDGSTDKTEEIACKYTNKYSKSFMLINKENGGHGSTINASRKVAKGKYYKAVDADDWVDRDGIIKLVQNLKNINVDLIYNPIHYVYQDDNKIELVGCTTDSTSIPCNEILDFEAYSRSLRLSIHGMTIRTELIQKSGYMIDEGCFYVDQEYILYYLLNVKKLVVYDFPVYEYLNGRVGQSIDFNSYIKKRNQHEKVIFSVVDFWNENKDSFKPNTNYMIIKQISMLVCIQYKIYMSMDNSLMAKSELVIFEKKIKNKSIEIYRSALSRGKIVKAVHIISCFNYAGFGLLKKVISMLL